MYAPQSPFSRKVRASAIELRVDHLFDLEYVEVVPGQPNFEYTHKVNPIGKIPALVVSDDQLIFDSTVICEYLEQLAGARLGEMDQADNRWSILTRHAVAHGACDALISIRYETWLRPAARRWDGWIEDQWRKVNAALDWFEEHASTALHERPDLAEIALGCALGYSEFRWPTVDLTGGRPRLRQWWGAMQARPSFVRTRPTDPARLGLER